MSHPPGSLEWLQSRRLQAYEELRVLVFQAGKLSIEINRLHRIVLSFDSLISKEEAAAWLRNQPAPKPKPAKPRKPKPKPPVQASEPPRPPAERRGLIPPETEEERALRLPPPELPVPVVEAEEQKDSDHVIAEDIDRRARAMVSHGYRCLGKRRSRRYEGLR